MHAIRCPAACVLLVLHRPQEALYSVASQFLNKIEMPDKEREGVIDICVDMQSRVTALTHRYIAERGRYYYVTPTSYLELIATFTNLIDSKREELVGAKRRYDNGLEKIEQTANMAWGGSRRRRECSVGMRAHVSCVLPTVSQSSLLRRLPPRSVRIAHS